MNIFNEGYKTKKTYGFTPSMARQADNIKDIDQPTVALAFNHPLDSHSNQITELKKQKITLFKV